jgi:hypothetical protein
VRRDDGIIAGMLETKCAADPALKLENSIRFQLPNVCYGGKRYGDALPDYERLNVGSAFKNARYPLNKAAVAVDLSRCRQTPTYLKSRPEALNTTCPRDMLDLTSHFVVRN